MPQVDLETLVSACAGGGSCDNKIACETLATDKDDNNKPDNQLPDQPEIPADFPPESFWLSKDAEFDWFDRNAFYERKESQKGNSNSTSLNPNPSSTSQRFATTLKPKPSIIGLPKPQKTIVDTKSKRNCKPVNTRWFPKRSGSTLKSDATLTEPSSPNVSCMGRVRSKRDRRRLKHRQRSTSESGTLKKKPEKREKAGLFSKFRAIFGSGLKNGGKVMSHDIRERLPPGDVDAPPRKSLGGMKRFTSGRRSDAWADDVV
ncbi:hypothetical protein Pint_36029 [Pistacia integerrima]|uniref:Uncharacterized protein n=1 Tax=Pistacia integerrima TaxID=434235 RepID=A0ACC0Y3U0_9ROSI|nr:hypothetical protein Pint_36029 [Pistacia integerrima]